MTDVLFISPGVAAGIYQDLSAYYTCIEPPTWALLLAESCRSSGFKVGILDINAERISNEETLIRIKGLNPRLLCFVVYGQNVNAGTVGMSGAVELSTFLKASGIDTPISYIGSYVQALPRKALEEEKSIDIAFMNEGVYALRNLLSSNINLNELDKINGIAWRKNGEIVINPPEKVVPDLLMTKDLPGYAWDLLPFKEKPFDLYRAPMWHASYEDSKRSPYAAIQTSLGCVFKCNFCIINSINRNDTDEIGVASNYSKMRFWSPEFIIKEFDKLFKYGVRTIKITDELFFLDKKHYIPICEALKEKGYGEDLQLWAYSRVDTIPSPDILKLVRKAGIKWIALGIESSNKNIRLEVSKGKFKDVDIKRVVSQIHDAGIEVMANYIFGLPGDTLDTMKETLDLSKELCTSGWNGYAAMNLPGSKLFYDAEKANKPKPKTYSGYSFHSYDSVCNQTDSLTSAQILKFRDNSFKEYHSNESFLERIKNIYGIKAVDNIKKMTEIRLKRKILGD